MCKAIILLMGCTLLLLPGISAAGERFDGTWSTKLTCPAKGNTEGYSWQFASVIQNNNLRGERGTAGEPGYLLIQGKIAEDGSTKLSATGNTPVASSPTKVKIMAMTSRLNSKRQKAQAPGTKGSAW
jgi:hypothetical protein